MLKVGLTGGIGGGKTTVAKIFETLGIPVYYADAAAKELMHSNEELISQIRENFGEEAYTNGHLNRKFISSIVFNDPEKLAILNSLTHPATIKAAGEWMKLQKSPYVIKEAALLFESGSDKGLDCVIGVTAPQVLRIRRVIERDGLTREEILKRMSQQMDEEQKMRKCDFLIVNDEQELVIPQVLKLHEELLALSSKGSF